MGYYETSILKTIRRFIALIVSSLIIIILYLSYQVFTYNPKWYSHDLSLPNDRSATFEYLTDFDKVRLWRTHLHDRSPVNIDWSNGDDGGSQYNGPDKPNIVFEESILVEGRIIDYQVEVISYHELISLEFRYSKKEAFEMEVKYSLLEHSQGTRLELRHKTTFEHFLAIAIANFLEAQIFEGWQRDLNSLRLL